MTKSINSVQEENMNEEQEAADFAEQLADERVRGQNWLKYAQELRKEEALEEEDEDAEAEASKKKDPFDVPLKTKGGRRPSWLSGGISTSPENAKPIMTKRGPGRPPGSKNKIDKRDRAMRESIQIMTAAGVKLSVIAKLLKMKPDKLREAFPDEVEYGDDILKSRMVNSLIQKALDGNVQALIFYLKSKANWKEATDKDVGSGDNVALSEVERTQRLMSILMGNPALLEKMKQKQQEAPPIEVKPVEQKKIPVRSDSADDEDDDDGDEDGDVFDV
jgi:hypothetical protein